MVPQRFYISAETKIILSVHYNFQNGRLDSRQSLLIYLGNSVIIPLSCSPTSRINLNKYCYLFLIGKLIIHGWFGNCFNFHFLSGGSVGGVAVGQVPHPRIREFGFSVSSKGKITQKLVEIFIGITLEEDVTYVGSSLCRSQWPCLLAFTPFWVPGLGCGLQSVTHF